MLAAGPGAQGSTGPGQLNNQLPGDPASPEPASSTDIDTNEGGAHGQE